MKKKMGSLCLVLVIVCTCMTAAVSADTVSFADVPVDAYYAKPVSWAVYNGVTSGVGGDRFAPNEPCTRGQIMTMLWRAAGSPVSAGDTNPFADVASEDYFHDAVLWAVERGITAGVDTNHFGPGKPCTRAQVVTFLWKARGTQESVNSAGEFQDVPSDAYYAKAVAWAVENGVTSGVGSGRFGSDQTCTRGQIVTFLYKAWKGQPVIPAPYPGNTPDTAWGGRIYEFEEVGSDPLENFVEIGIYCHFDRYGNLWYDRSPKSNGFGKSIYQSFLFELTPTYFGNGRWGNRNNYWSTDGEASNNPWTMNNGFNYPGSWNGEKPKRIENPCPSDHEIKAYLKAALMYVQLGPESRLQCKLMYGLTDEMADIIDAQGIDALPIPSMGKQAPQGPS